MIPVLSLCKGRSRKGKILNNNHFKRILKKSSRKGQREIVSMVDRSRAQRSYYFITD